VAAERPADAAPRPTIPFDYLSVADELHSGRIKVADAAAAAEYRAVGEGIEAELSGPIEEVDVAIELLPVDADAIAAELELAGRSHIDLGRLRRAFALKNHPDRVAPHLRERAVARMQVANQLIDEAKRRALAKTRR